MNKQQLAAKIWEAANAMRSSIEANEYKDYILGFIFYKYLSEKQTRNCLKEGYEYEDLKTLDEQAAKIVKYFQERWGYFIPYEHLFSTWIEKGADFTTDDVYLGLEAFTRLIDRHHKKVFSDIFDTLQKGLSKLGSDSASRTSAVRGLIELIDDIPMDGKQGYDMLGFIYEYLIGQFASNAGKKAGEFYTPHEVSLLMADIVSRHLKDKSEISIYDSASGSGSLLINIGKAVARQNGNDKGISYYAQEKIDNTYNLTRMNLVMHDIEASNISVRKNDTLKEDWPLEDESNPSASKPLFVDAVVSNPPYSISWTQPEPGIDPRFEYGIAPKSKADFAFLQHDLYHLQPGGIMTIVLPHGVLFRGGEEGVIRERLIEQHNIKAIIGLPPNIFFGTSIPTIIMVLRKGSDNSNILFVDASKGFVKRGKQNVLRACDIKRIADTVSNYEEREKFSRIVRIEEIRENDYNLNIPRYVDSSEPAEQWDLYATMFGGIPVAEIDSLNTYWEAWPNLREQLFIEDGTPYTQLKTDFAKTLDKHDDIAGFRKAFECAFAGFSESLYTNLIENFERVVVPKEEERIGKDVFGRLDGIPLIDCYDAYQLIDDIWQQTSTDLEIMHSEGFRAVMQVDPNMVSKKVKGKKVEEQDGFVGRILPFELVQNELLKPQVEEINTKQLRMSTIDDALTEIIENLSEDELTKSISNEENTAFVAKEVTAYLKNAYTEISSPELDAIIGYLQLFERKASVSEKLAFIEANKQAPWSSMEASKNGTYTKGNTVKLLEALRKSFKFEEDSLEQKLVTVESLQAKQKALKSKIKALKEALHISTKAVIESLDDESACNLLRLKWIVALEDKLNTLPETKIREFDAAVKNLATKYSVTFAEVDSSIVAAENDLRLMMGELTGNEYDMAAIAELQSILSGE